MTAIKDLNSIFEEKSEENLENLMKQVSPYRHYGHSGYFFVVVVVRWCWQWGWGLSYAL